MHLPHDWRAWLQVVRARLQALSAHRLTLWALLTASGALFLTVLVTALPTARIRIVPRVSLVSHTTNVLLTLTGANLEGDTLGGRRRQHTLPLQPMHATVHRVLTFSEISKYFLGTNAEITMTLINEAEEPFSLQGGTRLVNQAGMIVRTLAPVSLPPATLAGPGVATVRARAQPKDLYGEIVGERGNVPAGLKWELPGLPLEERSKVYARNLEPATGGETAYGNLLRREDLELAKKQLEHELKEAAAAQVEEEIANLRARSGHHILVLQYDVLTSMSFSGMVLPTHLIGTSVSSIPLEGSLQYTVLAYDRDALLEMLLPELEEHIEEGQVLVGGSVLPEGMSVHVIEYDDRLQWVKITVEITGKQRAALSPVSPTGRLFGERVREAVKGKMVQEAERIIQNFPEVDHVDVSVWPPWKQTLPSLVSNIVLLPQE